MKYLPITPEDLAHMTAASQAHAIIVQVACACAVLANCLRDVRKQPKPFEPEDFMIGLEKKTPAEAVSEFANKLADVPVTIEAMECASVTPQG